MAAPAAARDPVRAWVAPASAGPEGCSLGVRVQADGAAHALCFASALFRSTTLHSNPRKEADDIFARTALVELADEFNHAADQAERRSFSNFELRQREHIG